MILEDEKKLLENIAETVSDFSVYFVKINEQYNDADLAGSGTLVAYRGKSAILTADHVIDQLPESGHIGLAVPSRFLPRLQRITLAMEHVNRVRVARGNDDGEGPDLGLLILPPPEVSKLRSTKTFYNLEKRVEIMLPTPPGIEEGVWILSGSSPEWTENGDSEHGYKTVKYFRGIAGAGVVNEGYELDGFDYLNFEVDYGISYQGPQSYKGFSGGGLWQFKVNSNLKIERFLLSGVAFYQSELESNKRIISCHGRKSLYGNVVQKLESIASV